jgi:hypothetical protein
MMRGLVACLFALVMPVAAHSAVITVGVDALANSSSGGVGVPTLSLTVGQIFSSSVDPGDLWNAGALPRWSNADGLTGDLFATGSDDSGEAPGTLIGALFPDWTQNGLTAPYGSLVGEIGGVYQVLGTSFSGAAWGTGILNLFYWDENFADNTEFITATLTTVPEPLTLSLFGAGLIGLSLLRRRSKVRG